MTQLAQGDPWISLALVYLVTMLFTELITNNAAAVLMFPIALSTSQTLDANFMPFAIATRLPGSTVGWVERSETHRTKRRRLNFAPDKKRPRFAEGV